METINYKGIDFEVEYEYEYDYATPDSADGLTPGTGEEVNLIGIFHKETDFYDFLSDKQKAEIENIILQTI